MEQCQFASIAISTISADNFDSQYRWNILIKEYNILSSVYDVRLPATFQGVPIKQVKIYPSISQKNLVFLLLFSQYQSFYYI